MPVTASAIACTTPRSCWMRILRFHVAGHPDQQRSPYLRSRPHCSSAAPLARQHCPAQPPHPRHQPKPQCPHSHPNDWLPSNMIECEGLGAVQGERSRRPWLDEVDKPCGLPACPQTHSQRRRRRRRWCEGRAVEWNGREWGEGRCGGVWGAWTTGLLRSSDYSGRHVGPTLGTSDQ
jgi:hypothetical protein